MDCWHCRRNAVGACRFCGRGVCEDHAETQPFVLELFRGKDVTRALVVEERPDAFRRRVASKASDTETRGAANRSDAASAKRAMRPTDTPA